MKFHITRKNNFIFISSFILFIIGLLTFYPIYFSQNIIFKYAIHPFNLCAKFPKLWLFIKILFIILYIFSSIIVLNIIYNIMFSKHYTHEKKYLDLINTKIHLYIGKFKNKNIYITEDSLFQNILITGSIGSRKNK